MGIEQRNCLTCDEGFNDFCPESRRKCNHHCNCIWIHDSCHWCGVEFCGDCEELHPVGVHTAPDLVPVPVNS